MVLQWILLPTHEDFGHKETISDKRVVHNIYNTNPHNAY